MPCYFLCICHIESQHLRVHSSQVELHCFVERNNFYFIDEENCSYPAIITLIWYKLLYITVTFLLHLLLAFSTFPHFTLYSFCIIHPEWAAIYRSNFKQLLVQSIETIAKIEAGQIEFKYQVYFWKMTPRPILARATLNCLVFTDYSPVISSSG